MTAERDKLRKDAAAAEEKVSRLEAELREARDAQTANNLEAELNAARDRVATLEAQVNAPTGDADADALRAKVANLETKVAANDKAMAEAGKRFKQLKEKAKRRVEEESAKLKPLQTENDELRARLADGGDAPVQDDSKVKDLEKEVKALKKQLREAPKPSAASGDERVRELEQELEWAREDRGGEAELLGRSSRRQEEGPCGADAARPRSNDRGAWGSEQQNSQQGQSLVSLRGDVAKITDVRRAKRDDLEKEIARSRSPPRSSRKMRRHGEAARGRRRGVERGAGERWRRRWRRRGR